MDDSHFSVKNALGEDLDCLVEGNPTAVKTLVFVHGFGASKDETSNYFRDLAGSLSEDLRIVRFDFSGCGQSRGRFEDGNYSKWAEDLRVVLAYFRSNFSGDVFILSHSMGCFVTLALQPKGIKKTIFTGLPNHDVGYITHRLAVRIRSRAGGVFDPEGISVYPRSTGEVQKIGPSFWKVLKEFDPLREVEKFSKRTDLLIVRPKQDEVVGTENLAEYSKIPGVRIVWTDGNHSFADPEDRQRLIKIVKGFFLGI